MRVRIGSAGLKAGRDIMVAPMGASFSRTQTNTTGAQQTGPAYAWYVVLALTAIYMLSYVDRQILSLLVAPMKRDLGISDTRVGLLQGLAFGLFYTFMGLPLGRMADTMSRRKLIAVGIVLWSFFTSACSVARSFWSLFLARMGVGVGEASLSPAAYSLIADYFPGERLGVAISVYYMGVFLGSSLSLLVTGTLIDALAHTPVIHVPLLGAMASWRITFLLVGLPGLLFALLVYTIREPLRRDLLRTRSGEASRLSVREVLKEVGARGRSLAGISIGAIFQAVPTYALISWTPTYFQRVHGWTPGQSGRGLALLLLLFGCTGMYAGGRLSDYWQKHGVSEGPLRVGVVCAMGSVLLLPPAFLASNVDWIFVLLGPGIFFLALPMGTSAAALQRIFPNQARGQVSALFLFLLNLGGLSLGPLMPGLLNDRVFHSGKMIGASLAITIGSASLLMLLSFRATYRVYRADWASLATQREGRADALRS
ncbi:MAG: MFS transporter [Acidobacteriia bacterium]|nr:MFS transporter [Terriglobia bacterium]